MNSRDLRDATLPELLGKFASDAALLVRQELDLARAELTRNVRAAGEAAGAVGAAAALGVGAFGALTACIISALAIVLPAWLAALVVTVLYGAGALVLARGAKQRLTAALTEKPEQTIDTLKEDVEWTKSRTRSAKR